MGRQDYSQIGYGYSEAEARRNAIEDAETEYGHQEGYSGAMNCSTLETKCKCLEKPKKSKTCSVEKNVQKGARKWETVYVISPEWGSYGLPTATKKTQGDAMKEAKRLALEHQASYTVQIDKRLVSGTKDIAVVKPKASKMGKWLFEGEARC